MQIWSVYIPWIRFPHSLLYQEKRKTKPYSVFPITVFCTKCDIWLPNLFPHSLLFAECAKPFSFRSFSSTHTFEKREKRKTIVRQCGMSFSVFQTYDLCLANCSLLLSHIYSLPLPRVRASIMIV